MTALDEIRSYRRTLTKGVAAVLTVALTSAALTSAALTSAALAQVYRTEIVTSRMVIRVEGEAPSADTVMLLASLGKIESDLQLGMLFLVDGLVNPEGSHFTHPRIETYPLIKEKLVAAGVADFEGLLETLESGGDAATVTAAYTDVVTTLAQARSALHPSTKDMVLSIVEQVRAVVSEINPAGPTETANYQDGWSMLMVARGQVDLLLGDADPAVAQAATDMGMALDDVILSMPDPAITAPVAFDPAPIAALLAQLEALAGSI